MSDHHSLQVNLAHESLDSACLGHVTAAQAWTHLVLPMRMEAGCLLCATTAQAIPEAQILLQRSIGADAFRFVFAPMRQLEEFIAQAYDFEGIDVAEDAA